MYVQLSLGNHQSEERPSTCVVREAFDVGCEIEACKGEDLSRSGVSAEEVSRHVCEARLNS